MTDLEKAARLAMEAICGSGDFLFNWHDCEPTNEREMQAYQAALAANEKAFNALRQALEHPAQQQRKPWVGLMEEEVARVVSLAGFAPDWAEANIATQIVRVCQDILKEKNA